MAKHISIPDMWDDPDAGKPEKDPWARPVPGPNRKDAVKPANGTPEPNGEEDPWALPPEPAEDDWEADHRLMDELEQHLTRYLRDRYRMTRVDELLIIDSGQGMLTVRVTAPGTVTGVFTHATPDEPVETVTYEPADSTDFTARRILGDLHMQLPPAGFERHTDELPDRIHAMVRGLYSRMGDGRYVDLTVRDGLADQPFENPHPIFPLLFHQHGYDGYATMGPVRGDSLLVPVANENEKPMLLCIGFHKGDMRMGAIVYPHADPGLADVLHRLLLHYETR